MSIEKTIAFIKSHDRFLVTSHTNMEGDALGSELGFYFLVRKLGKTAVMVNEMSGIQMGDGIEALPGSDLQVVGVTFERNGRAAILADQVTSFELTDSLFDRETQPYTVVVYNTSDTAISAAGNLAFDDSPVLPNELMPPDPLEYNAEELAAAESSL